MAGAGLENERCPFRGQDKDVRYWHLADMPSCAAHVRFRRKSGQGFRSQNVSY
jgi:hypothetical protein